MITCKLWRALKFPPRANRLFQLTVATYALSETSFPPLVLLIALIFLPLSAFASRVIASMLSFIILISIPIFTLLQVFSGSFYGLLWALRTASTIAHIRRRGVYETLSLMPDGALGVNWVICMACLYSNGKYREFDSHYTWPIRLFLIFGIAVYFSPALPENQIWTLVAIIINMLTFTMWFRIEDMQSIVLACIMGMIAPTYTRHKIEVRIWTTAVYLFIQIVVYALVALFAASVLPAIYHLAEIQGWLPSVSRPIFSLAALYLMREHVIMSLWNRLMVRLETDSQDILFASCIIN